MITVIIAEPPCRPGETLRGGRVWWQGVLPAEQQSNPAQPATDGQVFSSRKDIRGGPMATLPESLATGGAEMEEPPIAMAVPSDVVEPEVVAVDYAVGDSWGAYTADAAQEAVAAVEVPLPMAMAVPAVEVQVPVPAAAPPRKRAASSAPKRPRKKPSEVQPRRLVGAAAAAAAAAASNPTATAFEVTNFPQAVSTPAYGVASAPPVTHCLPTAYAQPVATYPPPMEPAINAGPPAPPSQEPAEAGTMTDVVAAGSLILSGPGWSKIHNGHMRWKAALAVALQQSGDHTRRVYGELTSSGVFDTLVTAPPRHACARMFVCPQLPVGAACT